MYTLLLVDDETDIRDGLREVVPFEQYGFTVVGEAANGLEGLQKAEELHPDLIVTDIRMPLMDGLTMCREIRKALPATQFMILSGYDDFEYARQAIELHTMAYLLKPISSDEFTGMLADMKQKLDEDFAGRRNLVQLKRHYHNSLPLLREMLFSSLLTGGISAEKAKEMAQSYDVSLSAPRYALALMLPDHTAQSVKEEMSEPELLSFAIINILREVLGRDFLTYVFHFDGQIAALFLLNEGGQAMQEKVIGALDEARRTIRHYLETSLMIGLSSTVTALPSLPLAAQQAASALSQCSMYDKNEVLCAADIEPGSLQAAAPEEGLVRDLLASLKTNDRAGIRAALQSLLPEEAVKNMTLKAYRVYLMELMVALFHTIRDMDANDAGFESVLKELLRCPPPREAQRLLESIYIGVAEDVSSRRADAGTRIADEAQAYLRDNFAMETLNMDWLCGRLHISSSYFSMVFKKETGKTFHQCLTELRMSRAMTLLAQGDMRTSEVARAVGIPDPSYFSFVFKKHFGLSPSQVKRKQGGA